MKLKKDNIYYTLNIVKGQVEYTAVKLKSIDAVMVLYTDVEDDDFTMWESRPDFERAYRPTKPELLEHALGELQVQRYAVSEKLNVLHQEIQKCYSASTPKTTAGKKPSPPKKRKKQGSLPAGPASAAASGCWRRPRTTNSSRSGWRR